MLSLKMLDANILEVKEVTMSWTKTETSFWYYDIVNWTDCVNGKNEQPFKKMTPNAIEWVKKYYLPKLLTTLKDSVNLFS